MDLPNDYFQEKINPGILGKLPNLIHCSMYRGFALLNNFTYDDHDGLAALNASVKLESCSNFRKFNN